MTTDQSFNREIISNADTEMFLLVNHNALNFTIALFGVVTNVMNVVVFFKQGFDNTMNISFFGLAISDLCSLLTMIWLGWCVNPILVKSDIPVLFYEILHLTAGIPHICFVRITGCITVYITAERCLCITMPLKIKRIITPRVTTITTCLIYISIILTSVPEYQTSYLDWIFYPQRNQTVLALAFTSDRKKAEGIAFFMNSILGVICFIAVVGFTVLLVVQLKQKSKWRSQANVDKTLSESISSRDSKAMIMVVMIATVLIVCYSPGVIIALTSFILPEFSVLGEQTNAFYVAWSFAFTFEAVNSSVNIFVYYAMSTKFRETFDEIFCLIKDKKTKHAQKASTRISKVEL